MVLKQKKIPICEWKTHGSAQATDSEILLYALLISTVLGEKMALEAFINECPYTSATRFIDINSAHCSTNSMSILLPLGGIIGLLVTRLALHWPPR